MFVYRFFVHLRMAYASPQKLALVALGPSMDCSPEYDSTFGNVWAMLGMLLRKNISYIKNLHNQHSFVWVSYPIVTNTWYRRGVALQNWLDKLQHTLQFLRENITFVTHHFACFAKLTHNQGTIMVVWRNLLFILTMCSTVHFVCFSSCFLHGRLIMHECLT